MWIFEMPLKSHKIRRHWAHILSCCPPAKPSRSPPHLAETLQVPQSPLGLTGPFRLLSLQPLFGRPPGHASPYEPRPLGRQRPQRRWNRFCYQTLQLGKLVSPWSGGSRRCDFESPAFRFLCSPQPRPPNDIGRDINSCRGAGKAGGRLGHSEHLGVGSDSVRDEL